MQCEGIPHPLLTSTLFAPCHLSRTSTQVSCANAPVSFMTWSRLSYTTPPSLTVVPAMSNTTSSMDNEDRDGLSVASAITLWVDSTEQDDMVERHVSEQTDAELCAVLRAGDRPLDPSLSIPLSLYSSLLRDHRIPRKSYARQRQVIHAWVLTSRTLKRCMCIKSAPSRRSRLS